MLKMRTMIKVNEQDDVIISLYENLIFGIKMECRTQGFCIINDILVRTLTEGFLVATKREGDWGKQMINDVNLWNLQAVHSLDTHKIAFGRLDIPVIYLALLVKANPL